MTIYVIQMNLWGNQHSHSYVLPLAFMSKDKALKYGVEERIQQGLRYEPIVVEVELSD